MGGHEPMIRDVIEFRCAGVVCRRVDTLDIPVGAWRAALRRAGRRDGTRIRTFLTDPADGRRDQWVFAVRTDPPPEASARGLLLWRRVDELDMPLTSWRATLHRMAHREGVRVHTFLVPAVGTEHADTGGQLVYVVWANPGHAAASPSPPVPSTPAPSTSAPSRPGPARRPVTELADYAARRARSLTPANSARGPDTAAADDTAEEMDGRSRPRVRQAVSTTSPCAPRPTRAHSRERVDVDAADKDRARRPPRRGERERVAALDVAASAALPRPEEPAEMDKMELRGLRPGRHRRTRSSIPLVKPPPATSAGVAPAPSSGTGADAQSMGNGAGANSPD